MAIFQNPGLQAKPDSSLEALLAFSGPCDLAYWVWDSALFPCPAIAKNSVHLHHAMKQELSHQSLERRGSLSHGLFPDSLSKPSYAASFTVLWETTADEPVFSFEAIIWEQRHGATLWYNTFVEVVCLSCLHLLKWWYKLGKLKNAFCY